MSGNEKKIKISEWQTHKPNMFSVLMQKYLQEEDLLNNTVKTIQSDKQFSNLIPQNEITTTQLQGFRKWLFLLPRNTDSLNLIWEKTYELVNVFSNGQLNIDWNLMVKALYDGISYEQYNYFHKAMLWSFVIQYLEDLDTFQLDNNPGLEH